MTSTLDGRFVHKPTAASAYHYSTTSECNTSAPLTVTTSGLRYSLSRGTKGMPADMRKASRTSVALALRRNSCNSQESQDPACDNVSHEPVKLSCSSQTSASMSFDFTEMIKVFVLLLDPKAKTFELIQLVYPSATTTIGDIMRMIPLHATELSLGSQKYSGLCRPKDEQELSCLSQLASAVTENAVDSASIRTGEILVAIPRDYAVAEVAKFSQAILTNRRFTKLLRRNNPLAPKMRKHGDRKKDRKHKHKHRSRDAVHILEKHDEALEDGDEEQVMQRALEKAANAAAQANASIPASPTSHRARSMSSSASDAKTGSTGCSLSRHLQSHRITNRSDAASVGSSPSYDSSFASFSWIDGGASTFSTSSRGDSLGDSLSSWSKSLDDSFARNGKRPQHARHRSVGAGISSPRKQPKSGSLFWPIVFSFVACAYLLGSFLLDPRRADVADRTETIKNSPMGLSGLLLVIVVLATLRKVQFLSNRRQQRNNNKNTLPRPMLQSQCPAVRFFAKCRKLFS